MPVPLQLHGPNAAPVIEISGTPYALDSSGPGAAAGLSASTVGGDVRNIKTAAATLTAGDSGALCLFNNATGFTYTLPDAQPGLWFHFLVTTTVTSGVARIACASGDFLVGTIIQGSDGTYVPVGRTADGSTHLAWEGNGTTTGGITGDTIKVTAISTTQWAVEGYNSATGTEATPFKTS